MKTRLIFLATAITCFILTACSGNSGLNTSIDENKTDSTAGIQEQPSNFELLQGKWQSNDDKTNFLVFEKNHRKEISEGMQNWDDEEFILKDQCENETNKADNNSKEKDRYISCIKSDLCWYIESVSKEKLILQYMGRGNTLTYTRTKE